jgi:hypothetical protein
MEKIMKILNSNFISLVYGALWVTQYLKLCTTMNNMYVKGVILLWVTLHFTIVNLRHMNDKDLKGALTLICEGEEEGRGDPQNHR